MANVTVANTSANISGKTLITAENSYTVSGLYTFSRSPSAPFAVAASSANVTNLDADLLDGEHGSAIHNAANLTGTYAALSGAAITSLTAANLTGSHTLPDGVLSTNVPLLNAANTFSVTGQIIQGDSGFALTLGTGAAASTATARINGGTNAGTGPSLRFATGSTDQVFIGTIAGVIGSGTGVGAAIFSKADVQFYTNNSNTSKMGLDINGVLTLPTTDAVRGIILGSGGATAVPSIRVNGGTNAAAGSAISFARGGTDKVFVGTSSYINGAGGDQAAIFGAADIGFYTNNSSNAKWGINTAGDFTFGTSAHIADSSGTPTISSGFSASNSTIAGTDYAFVVTVGASPTGSSATLNFGHTWSTTPICTANSDHSGTATQVWVSPSTTQVQVGNAGSTVPGATEHFFVLCRGY